jgi:hypothetical protein
MILQPAGKQYKIFAPSSPVIVLLRIVWTVIMLGLVGVMLSLIVVTYNYQREQLAVDSAEHLVRGFLGGIDEGVRSSG